MTVATTSRLFFLSLLCFCTLHFSSKAQAQVWKDVYQWSPEWEDKYSAWVQQNWAKDFFSRQTLPNGQSNPYYGLRMDCADTIYSMRIIFSYESKLPFIAQDPTTEGRTVSNRMTRWNSVSDETERIRDFLEYIYGLMSTTSLPNDTFPVKINRQWVRPGGLIKTTAINHHSWSIKEILPIGVPHLIFNSRVGAYSGYELMDRTSWPNPEWVFETDFTPAGTAGFRYWRLAKDLNKPVWEVENYSEEQYHFQLKNWVNEATARLEVTNETDNQKLHRLLNTACQSAQDRISAISDGIQYLHAMKPGQCMDFDTYDNYSTPNRDQRLFDDFASLRRTYKQVLEDHGQAAIPADITPQLQKIFPYIQMTTAQETDRMKESSIDAQSTCLVQYSPSKKIDLAETKRRLYADLMSNNPMDDLQYRWGEVKGPSPQALACPSWEPWKPDLSEGD